MSLRRYSIRLLLLAAFLLLAVIAVITRPKSVVSAGQLSAGDVREIQRVVSRERWKRIAQKMMTREFGVARSHLQEIALGRIRVISSKALDEAIFEVREKSESGRRWSYQLERRTNGWTIIGFGYRGRKMPGN